MPVINFLNYKNICLRQFLNRCKQNGGIFRQQKNLLFKRLQSNKVNETTKASEGSQKPKKETGIRALIKEYGYSALGVYLGLSVIDLPICYVMVHSMGREKIEYYENKVKQTFGFGMSDEELNHKQSIDKIHDSIDRPDVETQENPSVMHKILTLFSLAEFAIAYGIHKSLLIIRVPITAAITPGVVNQLRRWGVRIGSDKLAKTAAIAKNNIGDYTAASPKFGSRPNRRRKWFNWFF